MEKEALNLRAAAFFAAYPKDDVVYITADGQAFTQKNKRFGDDHAKAKFDGILERVTRQELDQKPKPELSGDFLVFVQALAKGGLSGTILAKITEYGEDVEKHLSEDEFEEFKNLIEKLAAEKIEKQQALNARLDVLKGFGLTEPIAKKLAVSGLDDLTSLTEKQATDFKAVLAKEEQSKTT